MPQDVKVELNNLIKEIYEVFNINTTLQVMKNNFHKIQRTKLQFLCKLIIYHNK